MPPRVRYGGDAIMVGGQARALAFAPGGSRLVALGNTHTLRAWDLPAPTPVLDLTRSGAGSWTGLGFAGPNTAVVHLAAEFARVDLTSGRVEQIPGLPSPAGQRPEGVLVAPGGRFAAIVRRDQSYTGPMSIMRYELGVAENRKLLRVVPSAATLTRLVLDPARADELACTYNGAAIREDGSVIAIGTIAQPRYDARWAVFRWDATGELEDVVELGREPRDTYANNSHIFFPVGLHPLPDGRYAVSCRGRLCVIDLVTGQQVQSLEASGEELQNDAIDYGAVIDGGRRFAGAMRNGIGIWNLETGELEKARRFDESCFILAAAANDAGTLFAAADNHGLLVYNLPDLTPAYSPSGHRNPPRVVALCPRGRHVATSDGSALKMWHLASGELAWDRRTQVWASMVFSPDGERLFADGYLIDAATGAVLATPGGPDGTAHAWSPEDGRLVHLGYREGDVTGAEVHFDEGEEMTRIEEKPEEYLRCVPVISDDGRRALLASETVLYGYDMEKRERSWRLELDVVVMALSPDGALAAITTIGGNDVTLLDAVTGADRGLIPTGRSGLLQAMAIGAGDRIAIPADETGGVRVIAFDRSKPETNARSTDLTGGHSAKVCVLRFGKSGTELLSGAEDGSVCLWKLD